MALGKYNRRTVSATSGAVLPGATVSFYNQLTGLPATAYNDPDGLDPIGSSMTSGSQGEVEVFLDPGKYRITVELDDLYEEITYEPVTGDLAVVDAGEVALNFLSVATPTANSIPRILPNGFTELRTVAETRTDLGLGTAATGLLTTSGNRWDVVPYTDSEGTTEVGAALAFHAADASVDDYDWRISVSSATDGNLNFTRDDTTVVMTFNNTGQIQAGVFGSASFPTYSWAGDTDTGIFHEADNSIGFGCGGSIVFTLSTESLAITGALRANSSDSDIWFNNTTLATNYYKTKLSGGSSSSNSGQAFGNGAASNSVGGWVRNSAGKDVTVTEIETVAPSTTAGAESGNLQFYVMSAGVNAVRVALSATALTSSVPIAFSGGVEAATRTNLGLGGAALLNVGTTAGTVAAGNDSRLSDSREWTAATVDQVEAEAGVATTRRAWTAERVRQAIVAVGTTVGKALLNLTNPSAVRFIRINADNTVTARSDSEMRTDLGLGSAAVLADTAVVQTTGDQTVAGVKTVTSQMRLQNGGVTSGTAALLMGADATAITLTDATNKQAAISLPHYTLAEEPILILRARSLVSSTVLQWGGGLADFNAATQHVFFTAADNVTTTGTATFTIASNAVSSQVQLALPSYTVATLPTGVTAGMIFVSDESGGSVPAFYDGTDWRRVSDRAIVS
jgi:hypothetical protein